ncbi:MAG: hypothetical protein EOO61_07110 [Hymenobacter sp.]|nr:MAG: hypothetical protein EOO61_07110 [Hymenobacter sp.]
MSTKLQELCDLRAQLVTKSREEGVKEYEAYGEEMIELDRMICILLDKVEQRRLKEMLTVDYTSGKSNGQGLSITVFFPVDVDFALVKELTEKVVRKKWLSGCLYAYEQKGDSEDTLGHNPHVHIFCENFKRKSEAVREVYNSYKRIVSSQNSVHVEQKPAAWFPRCKSYLRGQKAGAKMAAVQFDEQWRNLHGLPHPEETAK